jgi:hypothetical protein
MQLVVRLLVGVGLWRTPEVVHTRVDVLGRL